MDLGLNLGGLKKKKPIDYKKSPLPMFQEKDEIMKE